MTFFSEIEAFVCSNPLYQECTPDLPLEDELAQCLTEEDLRSLDIPVHTLPKILRGLPRLVCQTDVRLSQITPPFRHLPHLKRYYIDKSLLSLYAPLTPPAGAKVILFTWVIADGLGDYLHQVETANTLRRIFPHLSVTLITLVHHEKQLPEVSKDWEHYVFRYSGALNGPIIYEVFSDQVMEQLCHADLLLEISSVFPHMEELKKHLPSPLYFERIGEHSLIEAAPYHPATGAHCMGLHFLEKGVFVKRLPLRASFPSWIAPLLPEEEYTFDFAYTKTFRGTYLYLHTLLTALKDNPKDAVICFFNMALLSQVIEKKLKSSCPAEWNVAAMEICDRHFLVKIPFAKTGKTVRLIHCEHLPYEDFLKLMTLSENLICCTGDHSVLEAIATRIPFFYDSAPYKRPFLKDLLKLAEQRIPGPLADFFRLCLKNPHLPAGDIQNAWMTEEQLQISSDLLSLTEVNDAEIGDALGTLLKKPELKKCFESLQSLLEQEYNFEPVLAGIVNRALQHLRNPHLAAEEKRELDAFVSGEQSGRTTLEKIKSLLEQTASIQCPSALFRCS